MLFGKGVEPLGGGALTKEVGQLVHIAPPAVLPLLPEFGYEVISLHVLPTTMEPIPLEL